MKVYKPSRKNSIENQVVITDGLSGAGKTALFKILASFERVEVARFDHIHEYICALIYLDGIRKDTAECLIRLHLDLAIYNVMISRGANFRPNDSSSVLKSNKQAKYLERLFLPDGKIVEERILKEKPILHIMTHQVLGIVKPLLEILGDRLTIIEIVRNPIYLIPAWASFIDRYGNDPLSLSVCINHKGSDVPWFAAGWEDEYLNVNRMDKVIKCFSYFTDLKDKFMKSLSRSEKNRVLQIPFEKYVTDPWHYIYEFEELIGDNHTDSTQNILEKQNMPRKITTDIPDHESFRRYDNISLVKGVEEKQEIEKLWDRVKKEASSEEIKILEKLYYQYNKKWNI